MFPDVYFLAAVHPYGTAAHLNGFFKPGAGGGEPPESVLTCWLQNTPAKPGNGPPARPG